MDAAIPLLVAIGGAFVVLTMPIWVSKILDLPAQRHLRPPRREPLPRNDSGPITYAIENPLVGGFAYTVAEQEGLWRK